MASSRRKSSGARPGREPSAASTLFRKLPLVFLLLGWLFVFLSLVGFHPADPPTHLIWPANTRIENWCGPVGAWTAYQLFKLLGFGAWVGVILAGLVLFSAAMGQALRHPAVRLLGLVMIVAAVAGLQALLFPHSGSFPDLAGGMAGVVGSGTLVRHFGQMGAAIWLSAGLLLGLVVAMDDWLAWSVSWMRRRAVPAACAAGEAAAPVVGAVGKVAGSAAVTMGRGAARAGGGLLSGLASFFRARQPARIRPNDLDDDQPDALAPRRRRELPKARVRVIAAPQPTPQHSTESAAQPSEPPIPEALGFDDPDAPIPDDADTPAAPARKPRSRPAREAEPIDAHEESIALDEEALRAKMAKLPVVFGQKNMHLATDEDLRNVQNAASDDNYAFPPIDLLENPEENFSERLEGFVREQAAALESALQQYNIKGEVVGIESGPVVTLYDVRLAAGTKVSQISAVESDIARALKAINIRIVPNQAGRDTIGIEVPNAQKEKVRLKELMSKPETYASMRLPMFLGKDASGRGLVADLTSMPHMLIAGTTGSGKSVCINTIIMGFLYTKRPGELKLVLVDPKMVEMAQFKDIPHLMCPVVTEMSKAAAILEWAVAKMDERYELLMDAGCRDIAAYNGLSWEELKSRFNPSSPEEEARIPRKLPYMVFVIDELADLILTHKEVEQSIIRIAQKARAVGLHLILATQRPQANVVTGLIKSNMPCRVAFKVASGMDSRIVLDQKGGELLLGQGDMLFLSPRTSKLSRSQGTLVDDGEIRKVVQFLKGIAQPNFERQLLNIRKADDGFEVGAPDSNNNSSASLKAAQEDPLFEKAVEIVLETRRGSVSLLQRRLAIGYTRASRLIDLMGIAGIIGEHKGSVAREVAITLEDWERMKNLAAAEARAQGIAWPPKPPEQGQLFPDPKSSDSGDSPAAPDDSAETLDEPDTDESDDADDVEDSTDAVSDELSDEPEASDFTSESHDLSTDQDDEDPNPRRSSAPPWRDDGESA